MVNLVIQEVTMASTAKGVLTNNASKKLKRDTYFTWETLNTKIKDANWRSSIFVESYNTGKQQ